MRPTPMSRPKKPPMTPPTIAPISTGMLGISPMRNGLTVGEAVGERLVMRAGLVTAPAMPLPDNTISSLPDACDVRRVVVRSAAVAPANTVIEYSTLTD